MTLEEALSDVRTVLLDSAPTIYHIEQHPTYAPVMASFLRLREAKGILLVTSPVTLAECLVQPIRLGRQDLIDSYGRTLLRGKGIRFCDIGADLAMRAAQVRAEHGLRLLDAFQVAIARRTGCEAILTNDTDFKRVDHPRAILLDDFVGDEES